MPRRLGPEEEAISLVRQFLKRAASPLTREAGRELYRAYLKRTMSGCTWRVGDAKAEKLIGRAKDGDQDADTIIREVAHSFLAHGYQLPELLNAYVLNLLVSPASYRPPRRRGPNPAQNWYRDIWLAMGVFLLTERGFKPTKKRTSTKTESACSIVENVSNTSEAAAEKIWMRAKVLDEDLGKMARVLSEK